MAEKSSRNRREETQDFRCRMGDHMHHHGGGSAVYGLGFLGALYYYVTTAATAGALVIGVLKAIVWPAFLVLGALKAMGL